MILRRPTTKMNEISRIGTEGFPQVDWGYFVQHRWIEYRPAALPVLNLKPAYVDLVWPEALEIGDHLTRLVFVECRSEGRHDAA